MVYMVLGAGAMSQQGSHSLRWSMGASLGASRPWQMWCQYRRSTRARRCWKLHCHGRSSLSGEHFPGLCGRLVISSILLRQHAGLLDAS